MNYTKDRKGLMLVMSSPSGAGKTTLTRRLLAEDNDILMSVSATTRPARPGEVEGKDYYFVTHEAFDEMVGTDQMLEHATVFENSYGTPREPVEQALSRGKDIVFDIDWQGAQQLEAEDIISIFILPPSVGELKKRLKSRAQDSDEVIAKRMDKADNEISHWAEYDYVLINDDLDATFAALKSIVAAERLKRTRQIGTSTFARSLMDDAG